MLILLDQRLRGRGLELLRSTGQASLLLSAHSERPGDPWRSPDGRERHELPEWMKSRLRLRPESNLIVVIWETPDDRLESLLGFLDRQRPDFELRVSVLLAGRLATDVALDFTARPEPMRVPYIGNQDSEKALLDPRRRSDAIQDVVSILLGGGDEAGKILGLMPDSFEPEGMVAGEANQDAATYQPFGIASYGYQPTDVRRLLGELAIEVLRDELRKPPSAGFDKETLERSPVLMLDMLRHLGTPLGGSEHPGETGRLAERLSPVPDNPFEEWRCPHARRRAREDGSRRIVGNRAPVQKYYLALLEELPKLARVVRTNGESLYQKGVVELHGQVDRASSLSNLAALLQHYFPCFARLRARSRKLEKNPCEAAARPDFSQCRTRFLDGAQNQLEESTQRLPTMTKLVVLYSGATLLTAGAVTALLKGAPDWIPATLGSAGILGGGGIYLWCYLIARRVKRQMVDYFDEAAAWLRGSFVRKLEWVVEQTQRTLELQVVSSGETIGRNLGRSLELVFQDWSTLLAGPAGSEPGMELLKQGVSQELIEDWRSRFRELAREIVASAREDRHSNSSASDLDHLLDEQASWAFEKSCETPVPEELAREEILDHARSRVSPPILSLLGDSVLQNGLRKVFVLPRGYSDELSREIRGACSGIRCEILTASVSGPAAWVVVRPVAERVMRASLETVGVSA